MSGMKYSAGLVVAALMAWNIAQANDNNPDTALCRPAMIGTNLNSLSAILARPSKLAKLVTLAPAAMDFTLAIDKNGRGFVTAVLRQTPNSRALWWVVDAAVRKSQFEPAIFCGHPVEVSASATVLLVLTNGKPQIRVNLCTVPEELAERENAVGPQRVLRWSPTPINPIRAVQEGVSAVVRYRVRVSENGAIKEAKIAYITGGAAAEYPFSDAVLEAARESAYIPGLRNGRPAEGVYESKWIFNNIHHPEIGQAP